MGEIVRRGGRWKKGNERVGEYGARVRENLERLWERDGRRETGERDGGERWQDGDVVVCCHYIIMQ